MTRIPVNEDDTSEKAVPAPANEPGVEADDSMASLQADIDRFRDLAARSQADFENYKKRCAREKEEAIKYANSALLEKLLPVVDNFELGLEAARGDGGEKSPIYSGMKMVLKQLQDFLAAQGAQPIEAVGQKFDPNLHEAIAHEAGGEAEGIVTRQTRRGYRFKDRLLRPSSVAVSKGSANS